MKKLLTLNNFTNLISFLDKIDKLLDINNL